MNKIIIIISSFNLITVTFLLLLSCVNANFSEIETADPVSILPLEVGNYWIYEIMIDNSTTYRDTSEITEYRSYELNNGDPIFLHLYKEINLREDNNSIIDTTYYRLLKVEDNCLYEYGVELRDEYNFYLYHEIYNERIKKVDYSSPIMNVLYESARYKIESKGYYDIELSNMLDEFHTIKVNHIFDYTDYLFQSNRGDFDIYYSDIGIVKMSGEIYDDWFNVELIESNLELPR